MRKTSFMSDYERVAVEKVLTAVLARENPTLSEQVIRAMVFREVDDIVKARKLQHESRKITLKISQFAEGLADYGVARCQADAYDVNAGRMYVIHFIVPKDGDSHVR